MIIWKQTRIPFLAITLSSVLLALGKIILFPSLDKPKITPFVFPEKISLSQWQQQPSYSLPIEQHSDLIAQKHYQYIQNGQPLDIEMRYVLVPGQDVYSLMQRYKSISSFSSVRHQGGVGFYGVGIYQQQAYLSSCINPRGESTLTQAQFNYNRYLYDLQPQRLLSWFLGQEELLDRRCLWVHLSVPLHSSSPEVAYQVLKKAWFSWYRLWQPRFPKP